MTRRSRLAWIVLLFVQLVAALSPLAEARGGTGARAHVEARGDYRHYSHAEANCAFCAVRTIHASVPFSAAQAPRGQELNHAIVTVALLEPSAGAFLSNLSRAPPAV